MRELAQQLAAGIDNGCSSPATTLDASTKFVQPLDEYCDPTLLEGRPEIVGAPPRPAFRVIGRLGLTHRSCHPDYRQRFVERLDELGRRHLSPSGRPVVSQVLHLDMRHEVDQISAKENREEPFLGVQRLDDFHSDVVGLPCFGSHDDHERARLCHPLENSREPDLTDSESTVVPPRDAVGFEEFSQSLDVGGFLPRVGNKGEVRGG